MDASRSGGDRPTDGPAPAFARPPTSYLFCDLRGYTSYTGEHGAEAAAVLVEAFLGTSRSVVAAHGGILRGSWGDQVLGEFVSARDAVRAALELVCRCTQGDTALCLPVGVGLDVGEPAGPEESSSSAALNLGARLCAAAGPGEVLATREIVHLAGTLPGVVAQDRGPRALKGIPGKVPVVRLLGDRVAPAPTPVGRRRPPRRAVPWLVGVVALVVLAGTLVALRVVDRPVPVATQGVTLLDPSSGSVRRSTELGSTLAGLGSSARDVWAVQAQAESVVRLDRATGRVADTVPVGNSPTEVAVDGDAAWVINASEATVSEVNGSTGRVVTTVPVGAEPTDVAVGFGRVWVTNGGAGTVTVLDAESGSLVRTVPVGEGPSGVAVGAGRVWVSLAHQDQVLGLDPATLKASDPYPVGTGPGAVVAGATDVWVANTLEQSVSHIDLAAERVRTVSVGDFPTSLALDGRRLWVGNAADGTLSQVDPARDRVVRTLDLHAAPTALALGRDGLWVATRPFSPAAHRGGTLTVAMQAVPNLLDPQQAYDPVNSPVVALVHATLLTVRRSQGAQADLVPDLAERVPRPSDHGRTYTFTLRSGVHYSDGSALVADDVRRGVERAFTAAHDDGGAPGLYTAIHGAAACLGATRCDLHQGITTGRDPVGRETVTFQLDRPDPDFLYKVALTLVAPVPPAADSRPLDNEGPPGTGPYKVQELTKKRVVLVRNPYFAQWSYAAQPAGNPDTIVWVAAKAADGIGRVEHGSADALLDATPAQLAQVALRHPAQIYRHHVYGTHFVELNTRVAPFDSLLARQAVAYAVDRRALGVLFSGSRLTACQLLPPGFPGRTGTCRYTARGQEDGEWPRPDLRRARALVDESGTAGARVDVSVWQDFPGGLPVARALQTTLRALGYRARLRLVPAGRGYWTWEGDARAPVQAGVYGWAVDYPAAGNFYDHITHCPRLALATDSEDLTGLCDPVTERLAQQARAAEATDRGSATAIWRQVYQRVEDSAAVIPTDYWDDPAFLGTRVGNVQTSSYWGPLLEQMWVR